MEQLANLIATEQIEKLASRSHFRYGKQMAEDGEVTITKSNRFNLEATVKFGGHEARKVNIISTPKGLRWKCTCSSKKGFFCQHCVAVALHQNLSEATET